MKLLGMGYHVCRVFSPCGLDRWAVQINWGCAYLNQYGQWDHPLCAIKFGDREEADHFARQTAHHRGDTWRAA